MIECGQMPAARAFCNILKKSNPSSNGTSVVYEATCKDRSIFANFYSDDMNVVYRVLSFIINIIAIMLSLALVMAFGAIVSSPVNMLSGFIMVSVILYAFFSSRFRIEVLTRQKEVSHSLRDWVKVNGIVTLVFSILTLVSGTLLISNPQPFVEALEAAGQQLTPEKINILFVVMLLYAVVLISHILWTFKLLRQHGEFFK